MILEVLVFILLLPARIAYYLALIATLSLLAVYGFWTLEDLFWRLLARRRDQRRWQQLMEVSGQALADFEDEPRRRAA
jgi:ABC-type transport system involved in Fe-S cluster assembly fused permease/ATPase subunit